MHTRERHDALRRACDLGLAPVVFLLLLPVAVVTALALAVKMGRPILFKQKRVGKDDRVFEVLKFRTMRLDSADAGVSSDAQRLTAFGRFLRSTSLDEIPQLWNVLRGDMALVGPRPLLPQYLPRYTSIQRRRHEVRPGITGWAQVNGRNAISWDDKFRMDVWYVDHRSVWLDLNILLLTAREVLYRRGVSSQGLATTSEFLGSVTEG
jgi:lipopolysaccharide/colanic/teichoic acid biosynthesis glycosyltransferase